MTSTPAQLRAYALNRSLGERQDLMATIDRLGFVQADPIRAPARAQDLILMQRARGYRAGDLERRYPELEVEEDALPNYGFFPRRHLRLLHPREVQAMRIDSHAPGLTDAVLAHLRERGELHPREVEARFGKASVGNYWGGQSSATTRALDALHHRGLARVTRRVNGVRLYAPHTHLEGVHAAPLSPAERAAGVVDLLLRLYAPLPEASLGYLVSLSSYGLPHLKPELRAALKAAKAELPRAKLDGLTYLWPEGETPESEVRAGVRLLAPFDPVVWDRRRFAHLHGWEYRFEAYTPAPGRRYGYYALPLLWGERAVGWANLKVNGGNGGELTSDIGLVPGVRRTAAFERALNAELDRYRVFLGLEKPGPEKPDSEKPGPATAPAARIVI